MIMAVLNIVAAAAVGFGSVIPNYVVLAVAVDNDFSVVVDVSPCVL